MCMCVVCLYCDGFGSDGGGGDGSIRGGDVIPYDGMIREFSCLIKISLPEKFKATLLETECDCGLAVYTPDAEWEKPSQERRTKTMQIIYS